MGRKRNINIDKQTRGTLSQYLFAYFRRRGKERKKGGEGEDRNVKKKVRRSVYEGEEKMAMNRGKKMKNGKGF